MSLGLIRSMKKDTLYIIVPDSTTYYLKEELYSLMQNKNTRIIITAIGGQGILVVRGNQQLSPRILHKSRRNNILIATTCDNLASLNSWPLLLDSGDLELDRIAG